MKKIFLLGLLAGVCGVAQAITVTAPSNLVGSNVLNGTYAYEWGIGISLAPGQTITSAAIDFTSVMLTASGNSKGTGVLYTDLLNSKNTGVTTFTDNDAPGDYFKTVFSGVNITSLTTQNFGKVGDSATWSDQITGNALSALNSYLVLNNGIFDFGLDPDCHFSVGNITFTYTLSNVPRNKTPEATTTALLLVFSLMGLELFRRQLGRLQKA
jgi:hypothetical protein